MFDLSFLSSLLSRARRAASPTAVDFPDAQSLEDFISAFPALARRLGSRRTAPSEPELAFLRRMRARDLPPGNVGRGNLLFLATVVAALAPRRALEIGTATGASTAVLASLMALVPDDAESADAPLVDTIDVKTHCLFDASKPIGFFIREIAPGMVPRVRIHTGRDSSLAPELFVPRSLDFAFIDGNHRHPWPLVDALRVIPLMQPGSWILLHDIDHPAVAARLGHPDGRFPVVATWPRGQRSTLASEECCTPEARRYSTPLFLDEISSHPAGACAHCGCLFGRRPRAERHVRPDPLRPSRRARQRRDLHQ